ncbi:hypothetical protein FA13DRAFT_1745588 [Coprinellus micaceus]|uniref:Uncharacterized protein n=1 Tax=Coprinellus micaceus TaxID=71717 RepID=A0A4Y7SAI3_COPMI|nr:hypothetical protein FA13DRAFT_1745588 [Coprinellus micaceus]
MVFPSYHPASDVEHDSSPSPYPPSTPSFDSDSEDERPNLVSGSLSATLAALPEHRLRDIVMRLAGSDSSFRRALKREPPSVADTPTEEGHDDQLVYHPGHLEDEVYEFVSRTPNGAASKVVQTVTMWNCCNEDEWSPGCILIAPAFDRDPGRLALLDMRSCLRKDPDVYPDDSDLESPYTSDLLTPVSPVRGQSMA